MDRMASLVLACNLEAINPTQPPRYDDLVARLRSAMRNRVELPDGYAYALDPAKITLPEVSEWIAMERLCCPFLIFQLADAGEPARLTMRGPEGAKAILHAEFPAGRMPSGGQVW
jgi:hypothetical protein